MRISDWSSDVCSSDLEGRPQSAGADDEDLRSGEHLLSEQPDLRQDGLPRIIFANLSLRIQSAASADSRIRCFNERRPEARLGASVRIRVSTVPESCRTIWSGRSEEHTSELQSLMRISYAVFCLKKKT